jgi:hypothetical protein
MKHIVKYFHDIAEKYAYLLLNNNHPLSYILMSSWCSQFTLTNVRYQLINVRYQFPNKRPKQDTKKWSTCSSHKKSPPDGSPCFVWNRQGLRLNRLNVSGFQTWRLHLLFTLTIFWYLVLASCLETGT